MYLQLEEKGICCFLALRVRYVFKASLEIEKSKKNVCRSGIKLVHLAFLMFKKMYSLHLSVSLAVNQNLNFFFSLSKIKLTCRMACICLRKSHLNLSLVLGICQTSEASDYTWVI